MKKKLVVIGNGMVSLRFLESFSNLDTANGWDILCLGEEPWPAYDRVHLSSWFEHRSSQDLLLAPENWYRENNVELRLGTRVSHVDSVHRFVLTASGDKILWDALVLATGSRPFVPALAGINLPGVFVYRTIADLEQIAAAAETATKAVVIGGGLLGLEAARATHDLGLPTAVIEYAPWLMPRQIDQAGGRFLDQAIRELGVKVHTTCKSTAFVGSTRVEGVQIEDGSIIPADLVLISAGIKPRDELGRQAGIACGERGGIQVNEFLETSVPGIWAIGECASFQGQIFGLVAPGYRMAEIAAQRIAGHDIQGFQGADLSTKLKLLGVDVASIGQLAEPDRGYHDLVLSDSMAGVYKRLQVDPADKTLKAAVLVGDAQDYSQLLQMYLNGIALPENAQGLLVPNSGGFQVGLDKLPDSAIICSCNNVSKASIVGAVKAGVHKLDELKACTRAGTGCGSCTTMVKDIMVHEMEKSGIVVDKSLCEHFKYTRTELYEIIKIKGYHSFKEVLANHGSGRGCEICKPTVGSILASILNEPAFTQDNLQDTNDRFLANIQKNGTYGIVPRMAGGEITPEKLLVIAQLAKDFDLYLKVTGAQRINLMGAKVEDLPAIWQRLVDAGMESGQAYAKALRAVKSCVGKAWCRFGVQDSTALAVRLEERYRGLRAPHKIKFGVSGCARECAEARGKDFGVIATEKGWNLYVCGNGGANPVHAKLLATDLDEQTLVRYIDRVMMYYIRTADKLTRTAPWLEGLPGGIEKLKAVVIEDSLGLGHEMEEEMTRLVANYQDEWAAALNNPAKLQTFKPFINTHDSDERITWDRVRGQKQPGVPSIRQHEGVTQ